jgi:hypothetical protein
MSPAFAMRALSLVRQCDNDINAAVITYETRSSLVSRLTVHDSQPSVALPIAAASIVLDKVKSRFGTVSRSIMLQFRPTLPRLENLDSKSPELVAIVSMYLATDGQRRQVRVPGWGCTCCGSRQTPIIGYDGWPLLDNSYLAPGDTRQLGFVFLSADAAQTLTQAGTFYLWDGDFVGQAVVVSKSQ